MVRTWTVGAWLGAVLALSCGSARRGPGPSQADGGGGGNASPSGGAGAANGDAGSASNAGSAGRAGASSAGQGGSEISGVGKGELDATCMTRSSNHLPGARIILRNAVTAEGDKAFLGFYDNQKKTECEIIEDAEGKFRCMPPANDDQTNHYFFDTECKDELEYRGICSTEYHAIQASSDSCDTRRRVYAFGERVADQTVYQLVNGTCQPYGTLNNLYRRGAELDPSEYAEVKPVLWRGAGRIWKEGYEGDGGLHLVTGLLDTQLNERCNYRLLGDGREHCIPWNQGSLQYRDASCNLPLLTSSTRCGWPLAHYGSYKSGGACEVGKKVVKADSNYDGPRYSATTCMPATDTSGDSAFSIKAAPDSDFLVAERTTLSSDAGRLKPMYLSAADGGCYFRDWWDEQLQTPCSFATPDSGASYYCQPIEDATSLALAVEAFSDSACQVAAPYVKVAGCTGAKPPKFSVVTGQSCAGGFGTIRSVDPTPVVPPSLWTKPNGTCTPYTLDATATYYAAGPVIPNSDFVRATPEP